MTCKHSNFDGSEYLCKILGVCCTGSEEEQDTCYVANLEAECRYLRAQVEYLSDDFK